MMSSLHGESARLASPKIILIMAPSILVGGALLGQCNADRLAGRDPASLELHRPRQGTVFESAGSTTLPADFLFFASSTALARSFSSSVLLDSGEYTRTVADVSLRFSATEDAA